MANRETFLDLRLAPVGGDKNAPREAVRIGLRFTEQALYEWETRGYEFPKRADVARNRTADMKRLLWAGLWGYRDYHEEKEPQWTMRSVNLLVERAGGWSPAFSKPMFEGYAAAHEGIEPEAAAEGKAEASSPAPTGELPSESRSATA